MLPNEDDGTAKYTMEGGSTARIDAVFLLKHVQDLVYKFHILHLIQQMLPYW